MDSLTVSTTKSQRKWRHVFHNVHLRKVFIIHLTLTEFSRITNRVRKNRKKLADLNLRFLKPNILGSDVDSDDIMKLSSIPTLLNTIVDGTKSNERIHSAYKLKLLSDEKKFRKPMALTRGLIETLSTVLCMESEEYSIHRCQQHALAILANLLLEVKIKLSVVFNIQFRIQ